MGLFRRFQPARASAGTPSVPEGQRLYVVGDIHGRLDLLAEIERRIFGDLSAAPIRAATTVFLGDYIDRGPNSSGVVEKLASRDFPTPIVALCGNHEDMVRKLLTGGGDASGWLQNGGIATLRSYGIPAAHFAAGDVADRMRQAIPERHTHFLMTLAASTMVGDYFLCHAGIRPGVPLAQQRTEDLFWIREEFLAAEDDHGKIVVHGHTPVRSPEVYPNRINIDTGAFATGRLTCLVLEGEDRRFIST